MPYPYLAYEHMNVMIGDRVYSVFYEDNFVDVDRKCDKHGTISEGGKELVQVYEILDADKMIEISLKSNLGRKIIRRTKKEVEKLTYCEECFQELIAEHQ